MEQFDRSCPADIIVPESTAELLRRRAAERWGAGACKGDLVMVWDADGDTRPIGAFLVSWSTPLAGEATIGDLLWNGDRADQDKIRRAINCLAGWPVAWRVEVPAAA